MLNARIRITLLAVLLIGLFLRNTGYTDADLFAQRVVKSNLFSFSTLSFLALNTASDTNLSRSIDISGLVPYGFAVTSYRIKKNGLLNFKYRLRVNFTGGSEPLCHSLNVKLMQADKFVFQGYLKDLVYSSALTADNYQDWIIFIGLEDPSSNLKAQTCLFELNLRTWRQNVDESSGIFSEQKLPGSVISGNW